MYHIISNIDKTINLQQCIENRDQKKLVGLKSFTYTFGWYNVVDQYIQKGDEKRIGFSSGFYNFEQVVEKFKENGIRLAVDEKNGSVQLRSPTELKISKGLKEMLGFSNKRRLNANQTYENEEPLDFAVYKKLYVHLNQINSDNNFFDGAPTNLLAVVPVENKTFGDVVHMHFNNPTYKRLSGGDITELTVTVRDENGQKINNNGLPISCVLEIKD